MRDILCLGITIINAQCTNVDKGQESVPGSHANTNDAMFYHVEATCDTGLPCPPYNNYKEVNCVVCTK